MASEVIIRSAKQADVPAIHTLIQPYVRSRHILPRGEEELSALIANGFVAEFNNDLVGFAAVEVYSKKLAELLCLAVAENCQGMGVGRLLVDRCVQHAHTLDVYEVMAITSKDDFFKSCGFDYTLPQEKRALFIHTGREPS